MTKANAARDELADRYLGMGRPGRARLASAFRPRFRRFDLLALSRGPLPVPEVESRIHAVGIGKKNDEGEPAVIVYVTRKLPMALVPPEKRVPEKTQGVRTDVVESPVARLAGACTQARRERVRPLIGGVSVSRAGGPSGTLGAFVRSLRDTDPKNAVFLLSNSHVLAPASGRVAGTEVVQPGTDDGQAEVIATVLRATRLHQTVPISADAAIARVTEGIPVDHRICEIGPIAGKLQAVKNMSVEKHGRSSGHTVGRVAATGLAAEVDDPERGRVLKFLNLFRVEQTAGDDSAVAELGDSGSLVVEKDTRNAVGLLHAADEFGTFYYAHPLDEVLQALEIELLLG